MNKYTLQQFREAYPNDDACLDKLFQLRFGHIKVCPTCNKETTFKRVKNRRAYQCIKCGKHHLYPTAGTPFEKTTIPLSFWFHAIYLQTTTRNGVSAKELERTFDICYKTALRMAHQIKILFSGGTRTQFEGIIEADETYIGGKESNKHKSKKNHNEKGGQGRGSYKDKKTVIGIIERNGQVIAKHVPKPLKEEIEPFIYQHVKRGERIITDEYYAYGQLNRNFKHDTIQHNLKVYVKGDVHTNTIENFWSNVKRTIKGTHIHVSDKHLQKYLDEISFRFSNRDKQDRMFDIALSNVVK